MEETEKIPLRDECRRWLLQHFEELGIKPLLLDGSEENFDDVSSNRKLKMSSTTKQKVWMLKNELVRKKK